MHKLLVLLKMKHSATFKVYKTAIASREAFIRKMNEEVQELKEGRKEK